VLRWLFAPSATCFEWKPKDCCAPGAGLVLLHCLAGKTDAVAQHAVSAQVRLCWLCPAACLMLCMLYGKQVQETPERCSLLSICQECSCAILRVVSFSMVSVLLHAALMLSAVFFCLSGFCSASLSTVSVWFYMCVL
jgi:hypothetical protein